VNSSFQNGVAEKANSTIRRSTTKSLDQSDLPRTYWPYAMKYSTILYNNQQLPMLNGSTPLSLFSDYVDNRSLYNWGSKIYFIDPKINKRCNA
jgi:hypothetical protein